MPPRGGTSSPGRHSIALDETDEVERLRWQARHAYMANDWQRLRSWVLQIAKNKPALNVEERFYLAVSQDSILKSYMDAYQELSTCSSASSEESLHFPTRDMSRTYRLEIGEQLIEAGQELLGVLLTQLIPHSADLEAKVDYLRLKGAQHLAISRIQNSSEELELARNAFTSAWHKCQALPATSVSRLTAANSVATFMCRDRGRPDLAVNIARHAAKAVDNAVRTLGDSLPEPLYPITKYLVKTLQENADAWSKTASLPRSPISAIKARFHSLILK